MKYARSRISSSVGCGAIAGDVFAVRLAAFFAGDLRVVFAATRLGALSLTPFVGTGDAVEDSVSLLGVLDFLRTVSTEFVIGLAVPGTYASSFCTPTCAV